MGLILSERGGKQIELALNMFDFALMYKFVSMDKITAILLWILYVLQAASCVSFYYEHSSVQKFDIERHT